MRAAPRTMPNNRIEPTVDGTKLYPADRLVLTYPVKC